jgi:hypothetical protein
LSSIAASTGWGIGRRAWRPAIWPRCWPVATGASVRPGGRPPLRCDQAPGAAAGGVGADRAEGRGGEDAPLADDRSPRCHHLARHPGHDPPAHAGRPGRRPGRGRARAGLPRGGRPPQDRPGPGGGGSRAPAEQPGGQATPGADRRSARHAQQARAALSGAAARIRPAAAADQPPRPRAPVDCRRPDRRLTVELDSYTYHRSRHAWEQDRRREREAYARGDEFRRYTYGDVFERPEPMLAELRALLARGPL